MRYFIPIDPATIRPSPQAGATTVSYPTGARHELAVAFAHADGHIARDIADGIESLVAFLDGELVDREIVRWDVVSYRLRAVVCPPDGDALPRLARSVGVLIEAAGGRLETCLATMTVEHARQRLSHPIPAFSGQHVPTEVACAACGARFLHTELESDDDDEGSWTNEKCPRCGAWGCCELDFEYLQSDGVPRGDPARDEGRFERDCC